MKSIFEKQIVNPLGEAQPSASAGVKNVIKAVDSILFPSLGFLLSNMAPVGTRGNANSQTSNLFTLVITALGEKTTDLQYS